MDKMFNFMNIETRVKEHDIILAVIVSCNVRRGTEIVFTFCSSTLRTKYSFTRMFVI